MAEASEPGATVVRIKMFNSLPEMPAECVPAEILTCKCLVHDDYRNRICIVIVVEWTALKHARARGLEVLRADADGTGARLHEVGKRSSISERETLIFSVAHV
jgi:hypothetical protein